MRKKLSTWKGHLLSMGGRVTLIKSALASLPIYNMSIYRMPKSVANQCEGVMRRFLWSGSDINKGLAKVNWKEVTRSTTLGGLGIGRMQDRNVSLLFKWVWEMLRGSRKLWADIVRRQYNLLSIGDLWKDREGRMSPIWRDILGVCGRGSAFFDLWTDNTSIKIGDGKNTVFWWDTWAGKKPLALEHPRLYHISSNQYGTVKEFGTWIDSVWEWETVWRRGLFEWERDEWVCLRAQLPLPCRGEQQPVLSWELDQSGTYTVHSGYKKWEESRFEPVPLLRSCWTGLAPYRVEFFLWLTLRERIATRTFLMRRNMIAEYLNVCPMCNTGPENVTHLFLRCEVATGIWEFIMRWLQVVWCQPQNLSDMWRTWGNYLPCTDKQTGRAWKILFYAVIWTIWKTRNGVVFRQTEYNDSRCINMIYSLWHWWLKSKDNGFSYSMSDILQSPAWLLNR